MKRKSERTRGRPVTGHIKVQFNITPRVKRLIDQAASDRGITRSQYIEELVLKRAAP